MIHELKKCPFCDGNAELKYSRQSDGQCSYKSAYIECSKCYCRAPYFIMDGYFGFTTREEDVIKKWNKRVGD